MRTATIFNFLVEATLIGSAVMLGVLLVRALLRKPLSSRFIRALWLLVALRLLLPIALPNPVMNAIKPTLSVDAGIRPMADQVRTRVGDAATALYWKAVGDNDVPPLIDLLRRLAQAASNGSLSWLIMVVYLSGAFGMAGGILIENLRFSRRLRPQPPTDALREQWARLCAQQGLKKVPRLVVSQALPAACAIGVFRPYAAVPPDAQEDSLRHACAHLRLRTGLSALLRDLCLCAHWFNPLVWICAYRARLDDALACDELAVADASGQERDRYASWLIHQKDVPFATPALWVAASCAAMNARALALRIRLTKHPGKVHPAALAVLCFAAALTFSVMFATDEQSSREYIPVFTSPPLLSAGDDLSTSEGAEALARRLVALEGIDAGAPSDYATAIQNADGWTVSLYMPSGESCEIVFDQQGNLLYYEDTSLHPSSLHPLAEPITAETDEGRAWCEFLSDFLERHAPETYDLFEAMEITGSGRIDGDEYLSIRLIDQQGEVCCTVDIQAAPDGRIFRFQRVKNGVEIYPF